jgi:cobyrinic acid a,c-diamide synthase
MLRKAMWRSADMRVPGYVPSKEALLLHERHRGLVLAGKHDIVARQAPGAMVSMRTCARMI